MRYTTLIDISEMPCYRNVNARILYLHLALKADRGGDVVASLRFLAMELDMTLSALRNALRQLLLDGVVKTEVTTQQTTQVVAHRTAYRTTQATTHLHVVTLNELRGASDTANGTASDTTNGTASDTANGTQNKNIEYNNKAEEKSLTHTHSREEENFYLEENIEVISKACALDQERTLELVTQFCATCDATNTTHSSLDDCMKHCISWIAKQPKKRPSTKREKPKTDDQLRAEQAAVAEAVGKEAVKVAQMSARALATKIPSPSSMTAEDLCTGMMQIHDGMDLAPIAVKMLENAAREIGTSLTSLHKMFWGQPNLRQQEIIERSREEK